MSITYNGQIVGVSADTLTAQNGNIMYSAIDNAFDSRHDNNVGYITLDSNVPYDLSLTSINVDSSQIANNNASTGDNMTRLQFMVITSTDFDSWQFPSTSLDVSDSAQMALIRHQTEVETVETGDLIPGDLTAKLIGELNSKIAVNGGKLKVNTDPLSPNRNVRYPNDSLRARCYVIFTAALAAAPVVSGKYSYGFDLTVDPA